MPHRVRPKPPEVLRLLLGRGVRRYVPAQIVQHLCYTMKMAAKNPRIHTVLDPRLFEVVKSLAREHGSSLSQEAHDLIREAVELHEDRALDELAERRRASWDPKAAMTAAEVRARIKGS